jgi:hypothetical protein
VGIVSVLYPIVVRAGSCAGGGETCAERCAGGPEGVAERRAGAEAVEDSDTSCAHSGGRGVAASVGGAGVLATLAIRGWSGE